MTLIVNGENTYAIICNQKYLLRALMSVACCNVISSRHSRSNVKLPLLIYRYLLCKSRLPYTEDNATAKHHGLRSLSGQPHHSRLQRVRNMDCLQGTHYSNLTAGTVYL